MGRRHRGIPPRTIAWAAGALLFLVWFQRTGSQTFRELFEKLGEKTAMAATVKKLGVDVADLDEKVAEHITDPESAIEIARSRLRYAGKGEIIIAVPGKK